MNVSILVLFGSAALFVSCSPQGPVSENFRRVSQWESQVQILRCDGEAHNDAVSGYRKKGWQLIGESSFESDRKISDREMQAFAARKRADQIVVSETWEGVKERISVTTLGPDREGAPDLPHRENYQRRAEIRDGEVQEVAKTRSQSWSYRLTFLRRL